MGRADSPMQMQRHDDATCPRCCSALWFGRKHEGTGWTVYYECSDCGFEERVGHIAMAEVTSEDEAYDRAESMGRRL